MKKTILSLAILFAAGGIGTAQGRFELPAGEPVLVYSLPQTELCIEVDVEKTTETPGEFYRYSGRYLAVKDVITEAKTTCRVTAVRVTTRGVADPARTFAVAATKDFPLSRIAVNERGVLRGVNVPPADALPTPSGQAAPPHADPAPVAKPLRLTESYMLASSTAQMADVVSKQIYSLRESRLALLTADLDQLPSDGLSLQTMLKGLDDMERELTELFTGKRTVTTTTHTLHLTPAEAMKGEVLFRLSSLAGLVAADDLSGAPYYIDIVPAKIDTYTPARAGKKASVARPELYTVLPAATEVRITDGRQVLYTERMYMPQFGELVPMPSELLLDKAARITVDEHTGRLLSITPDL